jgi:aminoglycoside/choline kinase family phosphotransferase
MLLASLRELDIWVRGMDKRLDQLNAWLINDLGFNETTITSASSDASFRRYFRVAKSGVTYIVMDAPPDKEDCQPFVDIAAAMQGYGLNVPQVLEKDLGQGFLLLTDLGSRQYLPELNEQSADMLYGDAIAALVRLQVNGDINTTLLPLYNRELLLAEMELFREWFVYKSLDVELSSDEHDDLTDVFEFLLDKALEQPKVWVHRDYHSRNLMITEENNPGVLDFQDAVIGPLTYDLVSLFKDCYIVWPRAKIEEWLGVYLQQAKSQGLNLEIDESQFLRWFDLMGVQRHLKVLGIFSRLNIRDGKSGYLKDIPLTLEYVRQIIPVVPELAPLELLIESKVLPRMN